MENLKRLEFEEIIKRVRKEIKEAYKGNKISVTKPYYGKIVIEIDNGDRSNPELLHKFNKNIIVD